MQLTHGLKGAWFQPLSLSSEKLQTAFKVAFKCNLHRYYVYYHASPHDRLGDELFDLYDLEAGGWHHLSRNIILQSKHTFN
jgi:hypothetical protein